MKRSSLILIVFLVSLFLANSALATFEFTERVGPPYFWSNATNWKPQSPGPPPVYMKPDGTQEVKIRYSQTCTLNSSEKWPRPLPWPPNPTQTRVRVYGNATLNIVTGGTLNGPGWMRVGSDGSAGTVNQSAGLLKIRFGNDDSRLVLGDKSGSVGTYNMSGGTMTYNTTDTGSGMLILGDRGGVGTLNITGTAPVIDMGTLRVGGRDSGRGATGNLNFTLTSNVSPVVVKTTLLDPDGASSTANLNVAIQGDPPTENCGVILLVENTDDYCFRLTGEFDTLNGGSAVEGASVTIAGVNYMLTYRYDAATGQKYVGNDIALIPEPATLALLGLGSLVALRRRR